MMMIIIMYQETAFHFEIVLLKFERLSEIFFRFMDAIQNHFCLTDPPFGFHAHVTSNWRIELNDIKPSGHTTLKQRRINVKSMY